MTNEEAREIILNTAFIGRSMEDIDTAIEMAAKALEQEPKNCNDCLFKKEWEKIGKLISVVLEKQAEQESTSYQWCTDCREYDQEKHCCHRWSKVIRDTVEEIKQEQEPIKALGEELRKVREGIKDGIVLYGYDKAVAICDKYLSETEADNGNDD